MSNKIQVTSAVKLNSKELTDLKNTLHLSSTDEITNIVDPSLVAGLTITINGKTVDLTIKHQLAEI